jgi:subtilisin-like proprotein convertase family protein
MKRANRTGKAAVAARLTILAVLVSLIVSGFRSETVSHSQTADPADQTSETSFGPGVITNTFSNTSPITIPEGGSATPYPSVINVSNVPSQLAQVTVTLNAMNHTFPSDIDIMLVGPQGQTAVIMSDVGGGTDLVGTNITLDDQAPTAIPATITSGTYRPTNSGLTDAFPAPAPIQDGSSALSVFQGTNPNGEWRLFVFDDVNVDGGTITNGWTLKLTAAISGQNTGGISIPESGMASPYPSTIDLAGFSDPVSKVQVHLTGFTHSSPDDVDVLLVSPSGRSVVLMSDAGGSTAVSNLTVSFDDSASGSLSDNAPILAGTYRPTDFEPGEAFPAPAPGGGPTGRTLSSLNGTNANGTWRLFVVDDSGANVGSVAGGWSILVRTTTGLVMIGGSGAATPYPAEFNVSGLPGSITKAIVTLRNFSHLVPDDVDILLVGPDGRRVVLMSDAGGSNEIGGVDLTFDDMAPSSLPDSGVIGGGVFRPTDHEPGDVFPAPAPAGPPTGNTLGAFYGGVPNGTWKLYIVGDGSTSFGTMAPTWEVILQTSTSACAHSVSPSVQAVPVGGGSGSFNVIQPTGCSWTATTTDSFISVTSGSSGGGNGPVSFSVAANQGPARTGTIDVSNGVLTRSFQIQQPSGCPLAVERSVVNFAGAGGNGALGVTAGAACSWQGSTVAGWVQITSAPQNGSGTLAFTVLPNLARTPRTTTIDIGSATVTVNQAPSRSAPFDFDGDRRTDISVFRPSNGEWWIAPSGQPGTATATHFGIEADRIAPADLDGDSKTDIAVFRDGVWYVLRSSDGTFTILGWGTAGDVPVPADYNSDGSAEFAVYRPSSGTWWILNGDGTFRSLAFGIDGDTPTPADYDGDGKADISVYRNAVAPGEQGSWWIIHSASNTVTQTIFGIPADIPVAADFDGDGRDNIAVYRPSTGVWYRSTDASRNYDAVQWGTGGDRPVTGDFDGDAKADPAVVRSGANLVWYVLGTTSGATAVQFGIPDDRAVPGAYIP